ncbi:MAG: hypothetical protein MJ252_12970, partial [archaeon]|nr:hypothetical protein [archaeon]
MMEQKKIPQLTESQILLGNLAKDMMDKDKRLGRNLKERADGLEQEVAMLKDELESLKSKNIKIPVEDKIAMHRQSLLGIKNIPVPIQNQNNTGTEGDNNFQRKTIKMSTIKSRPEEIEIGIKSADINKKLDTLKSKENLSAKNSMGRRSVMGLGFTPRRQSANTGPERSPTSLRTPLRKRTVESRKPKMSLTENEKKVEKTENIN